MCNVTTNCFHDLKSLLILKMILDQEDVRFQIMAHTFKSQKYHAWKPLIDQKRYCRRGLSKSGQAMKFYVTIWKCIEWKCVEQQNLLLSEQLKANWVDACQAFLKKSIMMQKFMQRIISRARRSDHSYDMQTAV